MASLLFLNLLWEDWVVSHIRHKYKGILANGFCEISLKGLNLG